MYGVGIKRIKSHILYQKGAYMIKKKKITIAVLILSGLAIIYFLSRYLWKVWNENAFEIMTEWLLPAGRLYK